MRKKGPGSRLLARGERRRRSYEPVDHPVYDISIDDVMANLEFPGPYRWVL